MVMDFDFIRLSIRWWNRWVLLGILMEKERSKYMFNSIDFYQSILRNESNIILRDIIFLKWTNSPGHVGQFKRDIEVVLEMIIGTLSDIWSYRYMCPWIECICLSFSFIFFLDNTTTCLDLKVNTTILEGRSSVDWLRNEFTAERTSTTMWT